MQKRTLQFSLLGLATGFACSFLGIGGGVLLVPGLLAMGFDIKKAIGSSLAAIVLISLVGAATHFVINPLNINLITVLILLVGALFGSKAGVSLVKRLHSRALIVLFAFFLAFVALKMIGLIGFGAVEANGLGPQTSPLLVFVGLVAGFVSALFGIGGGTIYVPMMNIFFEFPIHSAIATSITTIVGTALFGAFFYKKLKNMDFEAVKAIAPFGLIGAVSGAVTTSMVKAPDMKFFFGLFLLIVAIKLLLGNKKYGKGN